MIPFMDLGRLHRSLGGELSEAIDRVISGSAFIGGSECAAFEAEFGAAHDLPAGAGCGSGTDALTLALRSCGVQPGDEVVVPSMTFVATAEAVVHAGAIPVVADVDSASLLLTPHTVEGRLSDRTTAVVPVHLYGHVVPVEHLRHWKALGLLVIEDAAQAHLARDGDVPVGTIGDAACFSFYPGKNLGALGDGGMVLSQHSEVVAEARRLRDHGRTSKFVHEVPGWCSRLDGLQAAVLRVKLRHLAAWTEARRRIACRYQELIGGHLVPWTDGAVHHLLVSRVDNRDEVQARLKAHAIGSGRHYPVSMTQQPWLKAAGPAPTPNADGAANEVLSLPIDPLMELASVDAVCEVFLSAVRAR